MSYSGAVERLDYTRLHTINNTRYLQNARKTQLRSVSAYYCGNQHTGLVPREPLPQGLCNTAQPYLRDGHRVLLESIEAWPLLDVQMS